MTHGLDGIKSFVKFHEYIPYGLGVMSQTQSKHLHYIEFLAKELTQKPNKAEFSSLFATHRLDMMKFHEYIPYSLGVITGT